MKDANLTFAQAIERLRQRRIDWVKAHPTAEVKVQFNDAGYDHIIMSFLTSIEKRLIRFNQAGCKMLLFMTAPEDGWVSFTMVRMAVDDDYYNENKEHL